MNDDEFASLLTGIPLGYLLARGLSWAAGGAVGLDMLATKTTKLEVVDPRTPGRTALGERPLRRNHDRPGWRVHPEAEARPRS